MEDDDHDRDPAGCLTIILLSVIFWLLVAIGITYWRQHG